VVLKAILALALLQPFPPLAAGRADPRRPGSRHPALSALAEAFREEDAEALRPLLQGEHKLYVVSPSLGLRKGYYSPDQIFLIFRDLFRTRTTVEFRVAPRDSSPPDEPRELTVVGRWTFRQARSAERRTTLVITLAQRSGGWDLRELREVP
jgi:hypothetical protein